MADTSKLSREQRKRRRQYERLRPQIDALYNDLHQRYPRTFFRDPEKVHPLKVGIADDLRARVDVPNRVFRYVMKRYTDQPAYLRALIAQKPRLDLAGQAVGTVTDDERAHAQSRLNQWERQRRPKASRRQQVHGESVTSEPKPGGYG